MTPVATPTISENQAALTDPVVDAVFAVRERLAAQHGNDLRAIYNATKAHESAARSITVSLPPASPRPPRSPECTD